MAHVRYDKILTHSHTTSGLSCHFSIYIYIFFFFFLGGGGSVSSGNCETIESLKKFQISTLLANLGIILILLYIVGEKFC